MMTLVYRGIVALIIGLVGWNLYTEKELPKQINNAIVLIPLVLRFLMIK